MLDNQNKIRKRKTKYQIEGRLIEIYYRIVAGENDRDIMRALLLSERNYYKYKQKLAKKLEKYQIERHNSAIWLEVHTLKDRMSKLYSALSERVTNPTTKSSDLPNLASTAESIAINILRLESAGLTAIQQSTILENHINKQLPSRSKYEEIPKISYIDNNKRVESENLKESNIVETNTNDIIYNDRF